MASGALSQGLAAVAVAGVVMAGCGPTANGVAEAGPAQEVSRDQAIVLDGSGSSDPEGQPLAYTWRQIHGPDVTGGAGVLTGPSHVLQAPPSVCTLVFELRVDDGNGPGAPDRVQFDVLEDASAALWVDGDAGNDLTGDGTRAAPYATLEKAVQIASASTTTRPDLYVRARAGGASYAVEAVEGLGLRVPSGTSLYGGYGEGWVRDTALARTRVISKGFGFVLDDVDADTWVSGFDLTVTPYQWYWEVVGILASRGARGLVIEDNLIAAGDTDPAFYEPLEKGGGASYGVRVQGVGAVAILGNRITAGAGSPGYPGTDGLDGEAGASGADAPEHQGGAGGTAPWPHGGYAGGRGGNGGGGFYSNGDWGAQGADALGIHPPPCGAGGYGGGTGGTGSPAYGGDGVEGCNGSTGWDGEGGSGTGPFTKGRFGDDYTTFTPDNCGAYGDRGYGGGGGGGGGGGEGGLIAADGAGGGGGGQGGGGGYGGQGGGPGGASMGVALLGAIWSAAISGNTIRAGVGGAGGPGGDGGMGAPGGRGGAPGTADAGAGGASAGGLGGRGGRGGNGGKGGAGGGGPSYGVFVDVGIAPVIANNVIASGDGGAGGDNGAARGGGQGGYSFAIYDRILDNGSPDPAIPVLDTTNQLTHGAAGMPGGPDGLAALAGDMNFSTSF